MRRIVRVILIVLTIVGLLGFLSFGFVTKVDANDTKETWTNWVWFGSPWRWYETQTVKVIVGDKTEIEKTGGLILLSPAWLILFGTIAAAIMAHRLSPERYLDRLIMQNARRKLVFATLDEALRDAEHLMAVGYDRAGQWDLAQVCFHLAEWMRYPVDGPPKPPFLIRIVLGVVRPTVGRRMLLTLLRDGMPSGKPTFPQTVAAPDGDASAAIARLRAAAESFRNHTGDYYPSPLFGWLSRDEALRLQLRHCEHHLSFLVPKS